MEVVVEEEVASEDPEKFNDEQPDEDMDSYEERKGNNKTVTFVEVTGGQYEDDDEEDEENEDENDEKIVVLDREKVLEKLKEVESFIKVYGRNSLVTMTMEANDRPFLNVLSRRVDRFLVDQGCLRLNIKINDDWRVCCHLLTSNRELIQEAVFDSNDVVELRAMIDTLNGDRFKQCIGFSDIYFASHHARKPNLLIEKYGGTVIYRSRNCSFVIDLLNRDDVESPVNIVNCIECKNLYTDLKFQYKSENNQETETLTESSSSSQKRKRGRPKGSRNKIYHTLEFCDTSVTIATTPGPDSEELKERLGQIKSDPKDEEEGKENQKREEEEEEKMPSEAKIEDLEMVDDPEDEDFNVSHGIRHRVTTKRQKALMTKRRRGRPPSRSSPVECPDCDQEFTLMKDYKEHCASHKSTFPCDFENCSKKFKSQKELDIHIRKHKGEKPYICSDCGKDYLTRQDLRLHYRKHTGEKPFKCEMCNKKFARNQQKKIHMAVHTGERAFLCPECGSSFGSMSTLIDHRKRRHLEMRNHKCKLCPKGFFTRQELEAHCRTHTGEKPFQCTLCGKAFSRTHHLKRHIEGVHKQEANKHKMITENRTICINVSEGEEEEEEEDHGMVPTETVLIQGYEDDDTETETVLVTDSNDIVETTEYVVEAQEAPSQQLVVHKVNDGQGSIKYLSGAAATSLIQLSRVGVEREEDGEDGECETILIPQDLVSDSVTRYVVMESESGGTKLVEYTVQEDLKK